MLENIFAYMLDALAKFDCFRILIVINIRQRDI